MGTTLILASALGAASLIAIVAAIWILVRSDAPRGHSSSPPTPGSQRDAYELVERAAMPPEIASATLVLSEKTLHREGPRPFAAKTDQVFRTIDGVLIPVETKTRRRVFAGDIVQLSAQAVVLGQQGRVADYGYVRLATAGRKPHYQRVKLMREAEIDRLWERYQALRLKRAAPIARPSPSRCSRCAFRIGCQVAKTP